MSSVAAFELTLLLLVAVLGLELLAKVLRLPPAAALIAGGMALAFVPGFPTVSLDPELVFVLFLPPLLMDGAYFTAWADFRRNLGGILLLAIGAVAFTTLAVGLVAHWIVPGLPWAACFALGAVVSPPDAIAAKAVLERVALPRRLMVLLASPMLNTPVIAAATAKRNRTRPAASLSRLSPSQANYKRGKRHGSDSQQQNTAEISTEIGP